MKRLTPDPIGWSGTRDSDITDEGHIWPHVQNYGVLPSRTVFDAIVAANMANPGPIVLIVEKLPLKALSTPYVNT